MATTTPNFGWSVPESTDLVKDGATAIELLGDSIDASFIDLKGGTTGQVLTKASNTDLDFSFTTPTDQIPLTTKGDLLTFDTADARLGVGANGTVLTADSAETTGLKWATPAATSGPAFLAYRATSTQSFTGSVTTKVQLNAESFDTDSCYDPTTNYRFTPNKAGYYAVNLQSEANLSSAGFTRLLLYFNGNAVRESGNNASSANQYQSLSTIIYMNGTTDQIEMYLITEQNSTIPADTTKLRNYFNAVWIRS